MVGSDGRIESGEENMAAPVAGQVIHILKGDSCCLGLDLREDVTS